MNWDVVVYYLQVAGMLLSIQNCFDSLIYSKWSEKFGWSAQEHLFFAWSKNISTYLSVNEA